MGISDTDVWILSWKGEWDYSLTSRKQMFLRVPLTHTYFRIVPLLLLSIRRTRCLLDNCSLHSTFTLRNTFVKIWLFLFLLFYYHRACANNSSQWTMTESSCFILYVKGSACIFVKNMSNIVQFFPLFC